MYQRHYDGSKRFTHLKIDDMLSWNPRSFQVTAQRVVKGGIIETLYWTERDDKASLRLYSRDRFVQFCDTISRALGLSPELVRKSGDTITFRLTNPFGD